MYYSCVGIYTMYFFQGSCVHFLSNMLKNTKQNKNTLSADAEHRLILNWCQLIYIIIKVDFLFNSEPTLK